MVLLVEFCEVLGDHLVGDGVVLEVTLDEGLVRRHVDETVTGEVEEDDLLLTSLLAFLSLPDGGCNGMTTLGGRDDALGAGEEHASLESLELWDVDTMHQTVLDQLADNHAGTMVAQSTGMNIARTEIMTEGVHRQQGSIACLVTEVVAELSTRQLRTAVGLGSDELRMALSAQVMTHEGEGDTTEVRAATDSQSRYQDTRQPLPSASQPPDR